MSPWLHQQMNIWKANGSVAIASALLFELLVVLWLGFFMLFALETLLPTFVTIRLSLSNFLAFLILTTIFYLFLERQLDDIPSQTKTPRWLTVGVWGFGVILISLSFARFPLMGVVIFLVSYLCLTWVLSRFIHEQ